MLTSSSIRVFFCNFELKTIHRCIINQNTAKPHQNDRDSDTLVVVNVVIYLNKPLKRSTFSVGTCIYQNAEKRQCIRHRFILFFLICRPLTLHRHLLTSEFQSVSVCYALKNTTFIATWYGNMVKL